MKVPQRLLLISAALVLSLSAAAQTGSGAAPAHAEDVLPAGIVLPKSGMVFGVNNKRSSAELVQLHASEVVSNAHAASNMARAQVFMGPHATYELKGLNAIIHFQDSQPTFYVRIGFDEPELVRRRVHLIRMDQTAERRVVLTYSQNVFGGQRAKKYNEIPVTKTDAEADLWLKVTPDGPLAPGEYGIVIMPKDATMIPDAVYDFDVAFQEAKPEAK